MAVDGFDTISMCRNRVGRPRSTMSRIGAGITARSAT
jgi:hypothetical protein